MGWGWGGMLRTRVGKSLRGLEIGAHREERWRGLKRVAGCCRGHSQLARVGEYGRGLGQWETGRAERGERNWRGPQPKNRWGYSQRIRSTNPWTLRAHPFPWRHVRGPDRAIPDAKQRPSTTVDPTLDLDGRCKLCDWPQVRPFATERKPTCAHKKEDVLTL